MEILLKFGWIWGYPSGSPHLEAAFCSSFEDQISENRAEILRERRLMPSQVLGATHRSFHQWDLPQKWGTNISTNGLVVLKCIKHINETWFYMILHDFTWFYMILPYVLLQVGWAILSQTPRDESWSWCMRSIVSTSRRCSRHRQRNARAHCKVPGVTESGGPCNSVYREKSMIRWNTSCSWLK